MANVKRFNARHASKRSLARHASKRSLARRASPRKHTQRWNDEELADVCRFVDDHKDVPWKKKVDLWYQRHGIQRPIESIRGKYNYINTRPNCNDGFVQRTPSASGTVESFHTATESDLARLETQPFSTTEHPESGRYHQARQDPPLHSSTHDVEDRKRLLLPPITHFERFSMRPGHPGFNGHAWEAARMDIQTAFDQLLDGIFANFFLGEGTERR